MTEREQRIRACCTKPCGLTDRQLEEHIQGILRTLTKLKREHR